MLVTKHKSILTLLYIYGLIIISKSGVWGKSRNKIKTHNNDNDDLSERIKNDSLPYI